jgi:hypothetical protein
VIVQGLPLNPTTIYCLICLFVDLKERTLMLEAVSVVLILCRVKQETTVKPRNTKRMPNIRNLARTPLVIVAMYEGIWSGKGYS